MRINKNNLLLGTYVISMIPIMFFDFDKKKEYKIGLFHEWSTTMDWICIFYSAIIGFLIMAYCLHYPKGIDRRLTRMIFVLTILDFIHLVLFAMQGFGLLKIILAFVIVVFYDIIKKRYAES